MRQWLQLRDEDPNMFEEVIVMQQPSATLDEIITGWSLEDLAGRFPCCILQRDLLSGALTGRARLAAHLGQIVCCWISPGMTPVVQITDTHIAFMLKRKIAKYKTVLLRSMRAKADA